MKQHSEPGATRDEDADLARLRLVRVEEGAFEALYREFYPRLFDFVMRIVGSPVDVEEIINDTMLVVWNKSDEFAARSKVSTWIFGIAYKKALKRLKGNRRLAERELNLECEDVDARDPADTISDRALLEAIRGAVGRLPLAQRSIVHLAFFYGYTYAEIAEIVDCPVNTVKTRMFYARERLRPVLDKALDREKRDGHA
ncbi:MAG: RNA polymerase sigma factor [Gammaproteobacteria bacterium]